MADILESSPRLALDYHARAQEYRPKTSEGMAAAVKQLRDQGLSRRDIANALQLDIASIINLEALWDSSK
jgi:transposase-like protein